MEAGKPVDACPACGVPAKQFEPYVERISEKRLKLMKMDIHPIIVHMPQAFSALLVVLSILLLVTGNGSVHTLMHDTAVVLAIVLPFTVLAAFCAGLFDAKLRFRRVTTPILKRKMLAGISFFICASIAAVLVSLTGIGEVPTLVIFLILQVLGLGCGAVLGLMGSTLLNAAFPG